RHNHFRLLLEIKKTGNAVLLEEIAGVRTPVTKPNRMRFAQCARAMDEKRVMSLRVIRAKMVKPILNDRCNIAQNHHRSMAVNNPWHLKARLQESTHLALFAVAHACFSNIFWAAQEGIGKKRRNQAVQALRERTPFGVITFDPDTMTANDSAGNALALALDEQNQQVAEVVRIQVQSQLARFILHIRFKLLKRKNPRQPSQRGSPKLS